MIKQSIKLYSIVFGALVSAYLTASEHMVTSEVGACLSELANRMALQVIQPGEDLQLGFITDEKTTVSERSGQGLSVSSLSQTPLNREQQFRRTETLTSENEGLVDRQMSNTEQAAQHQILPNVKVVLLSKTATPESSLSSTLEGYTLVRIRSAASNELPSEQTPIQAIFITQATNNVMPSATTEEPYQNYSPARTPIVSSPTTVKGCCLISMSFFPKNGLCFDEA